MILLKNGMVLKDGVFVTSDILINGENIIDISPIILVTEQAEVIDCTGKWVRQGAVDAHVHLREPGFRYKETIASGTMSAAKGGVTTVLSMPNLSPVPDSKENIDIQKDIIAKTAVVKVHPFMSITKGQQGNELSDIGSLSVVGYSDDGKCVGDLYLLHQAMQKVKEHGSIISSHAEALEFNDSRQQEYMAVKREIALAGRIGCKYHFCHLSTKESLEYVRQARAASLDISCEVTPHHLALSEDDIAGTDYKMNPPLRPKSDVKAVIDAIVDGTASIIATDHAPHTEAEKSVDYAHAPNGIIGLETFLPVVYTYLVRTGIISAEKMVELTTTNVQARFLLPLNNLMVGDVADICVLDINNAREYTYEEIASKSKNSPFIGKELYGFNTLTIVSGKIVYRA